MVRLLKLFEVLLDSAVVNCLDQVSLFVGCRPFIDDGAVVRGHFRPTLCDAHAVGFFAYFAIFFGVGIVFLLICVGLWPFIRMLLAAQRLSLPAAAPLDTDTNLIAPVDTNPAATVIVAKRNKSSSNPSATT